MVVRRNRLAAELRRLREAAGLTCDQVAVQLDCSASKISRIETGQVRVSPRDVRDLLEIYGVPADQRDSFVELARETRQKGWWQAHQSVDPRRATYLGLEHAASLMRIYQVSRVHGLLLTEDYARAVFSAPTPGTTQRDTEQTVALLMERQRQARARLAALQVVLGEAALRRLAGAPGIMRGQIQHLIELSTQPRIHIQIIPFSAGVRPATDTSFTIMTFPHPADSDIVLIGHPTGLHRIEGTTEVSQYSALFMQLQAAALSPGDSRAHMTALLGNQEAPLAAAAQP